MAVFGEINSFLDLCARMKAWFRSNKRPVVEDSPADRLVRLFEAHGIHRNQIPRYIDRSLSLDDVQDNNKLLKVVDQKMIDDVAEMFAVNRAWLECASSDIYIPHDFYKRPNEFLTFLEELQSRRSGVYGIVYTSATERSPHRIDTFVLIEEHFSINENESLCRYHICNNWSFNYGKSRAYLIACVAAAWKRKAFIHGRKVPHDFIRKYIDGQNLLGEDIRDHSPGRHWHPEDMALDPEKLISGLDSSFDKSVALDTFVAIQSSDNNFSLDNMTSIFRGVPFSEKLNSLLADEK